MHHFQNARMIYFTFLDYYFLSH